MMTKMEMQYMDAVIQINRRQRNNEVDWEQRRYELAKAALFVAPVLHHDREEMTAELIAKYAVKIADAVVSELIETEKLYGKASIQPQGRGEHQVQGTTI